MKIGSLPYKEFKVMIMKMNKELRRRMDEVRNQRFLAKLENVKNQPETNNTIIEMKNTLFFH